MRLFVALDVPPDVRTALAAWARDAVGEDERVRLVAAESLHVTLVFLGERPDAEVAPLSAALTTALDRTGPPSPPLVVDGALWLSPRRPHVLAVRLVDPAGGLARIHAVVLEALGHEPEPRPHLPHVTVARVRGRVGRIRPFALPEPPSIGFTGTAVTLYRSHLGGGPARYEPMASVPLSTLP